MSRFTKDSVPALSVCASPVEGRLVQALFEVFEFVDYEDSYERLFSSKLRANFSYGEDDSFAIEIQAKCKELPSRTVDFVVFPGFLGSPFIVEIDGYEFHSSKEAFSIDRAKDRAALLKNLKTVRFSGQEVYADAHICARQILDMVLAQEEVASLEWKRADNYSDAKLKRILSEQAAQ